MQNAPDSGCWLAPAVCQGQPAPVYVDVILRRLAGKEPGVAVAGLARVEERREQLPVHLLAPVLHVRHDPPRRRLAIILP